MTVLRKQWRWFSAGFFTGLALVGLLLVMLAASAQAGQQARLTFYLPTGNPTASGLMPYSGSAACSYNWPLGSVLAFEDGREVTCLDRGLLGSSGWVDVLVGSYSEGQALVAQYGSYANVEVTRWGW